MDVKIYNWLDESDVKEFSFEYWNNSDYEKCKVFWVEGSNIDAVNAYLRDSGLYAALDSALSKVADLKGGLPDGKGIDLACGTFWSAKILFEKTNISHLTGVDFSRHRITDLSGKMMNIYGLDCTKVMLAVGNFYNLPLEGGSMNFVFLSQAFHHADRPLALLKEIYRVLASDGYVVLIGEHPINQGFRPIKNFLYSLFTQMPCFLWSWWPQNVKLRTGLASPPPDSVLGDHYYTKFMYSCMFKEAGFDFFYGNQGEKGEYFVLWKL